MLRIVVLIEFFVSLLCCFSTVLFLVLIFLSKSPKKLWQESPTLGLYFTSIALMVLMSIFYDISWILYAFDIVESGKANIYFYLIGGIIFVSSQIFYITTTLGIFVHRIFIVKMPLGPIEKFNKKIPSVIVPFILGVCLAMLILHVGHVANDAIIAPAGKSRVYS
ncbi:hypothetical protein L596_019734 [Steinernema carpocapsae]|uniref:Serpentine receptor class gamma n=1 Tax=Steinernema carpocapsae TaxID=34508 RepID=A0A4U5MRF2_STECR|nr:hypothetical protein L596_019734 [Steinernema carpocapsae]